MKIEEVIANLKLNKKVYLYDSVVFQDARWLEYQEREKCFWLHKITQTDYRPNPEENFAPFFEHWQIDRSYFKGKAVMEIGSGPFGFFSAVAQMGVDLLPETLVVVDPLMDFYQQFALADMIPDRALRVQAPGEDIPFPDNSFDVVLTTNTIDHVKDCAAFLKEINRLLKPGGLLLFTVHTIKPFMVHFELILKQIDRNHPYHFVPRQVSRLVEQAGFSITGQRLVSVYSENEIPAELNLMKRFVYQLGYRLTDSYYGVARTSSTFDKPVYKG